MVGGSNGADDGELKGPQGGVLSLRRLRSEPAVAIREATDSLVIGHPSKGQSMLRAVQSSMRE